MPEVCLLHLPPRLANSAKDVCLWAWKKCMCFLDGIAIWPVGAWVTLDVQYLHEQTCNTAELLWEEKYWRVIVESIVWMWSWRRNVWELFEWDNKMWLEHVNFRTWLLACIGKCERIRWIWHCRISSNPWICFPWSQPFSFILKKVVQSKDFSNRFKPNKHLE